MRLLRCVYQLGNKVIGNIHKFITGGRPVEGVRKFAATDLTMQLP